MDIPVRFGCLRAQSITVTQYDYGQVLYFEDLTVPDGTEVDFYQGSLNITRSIADDRVRIPDKMLQKVIPITVYIFSRTEDAGKTIYKLGVAVNYRPNLGNNPEPDSKEYRRLLPSGGEENAVLYKRSNTDYDVEWASAASIDDINLLLKER